MDFDGYSSFEWQGQADRCPVFLQIGDVVTTIPTIGFNVESVTYKNLNFNVWDLGGQTSIRPYWRCYYANTAAVIFVVDSTDIDRLQTAADELAAMLNEDELKDAALLVFANKQDQPGAKGAGDISQALRLGELRDRNWSIMACSAVDGSGVNEGMDWLVVSCDTHHIHLLLHWGLSLEHSASSIRIGAKLCLGLDTCTNLTSLANGLARVISY